jgi:hypothetical protein
MAVESIGGAYAAGRNSLQGAGMSPPSAASPETRAQQRKVEQLKAGEQKVIAHENAHKAAGGSYAGAITYQYARGPDGKSYIVGGEVSIDLSPGRTPDETIRKMQQVIAAADAPADPSGQDRSVAARAQAIEMQARQQQSQAGKGGKTGISLYA